MPKEMCLIQKKAACLVVEKIVIILFICMKVGTVVYYIVAPYFWNYLTSDKPN